MIPFGLAWINPQVPDLTFAIVKHFPLLSMPLPGSPFLLVKPPESEWGSIALQVEVRQYLEADSVWPPSFSCCTSWCFCPPAPPSCPAAASVATSKALRKPRCIMWTVFAYKSLKKPFLCPTSVVGLWAALLSLFSTLLMLDVCLLLFLPIQGVWTVIVSKAFAHNSFLIRCTSTPGCSAGVSFGERKKGFWRLFKWSESCSCPLIFSEDHNTPPFSFCWCNWIIC